MAHHYTGGTFLDISMSVCVYFYTKMSTKIDEDLHFFIQQ